MAGLGRARGSGHPSSGAVLQTPQFRLAHVLGGGGLTLLGVYQTFRKKLDPQWDVHCGRYLRKLLFLHVRSFHITEDLISLKKSSPKVMFIDFRNRRGGGRRERERETLM